MFYDNRLLFGPGTVVALWSEGRNQCNQFERIMKHDNKMCFQGDATTKMSHEQSCTYIKLFSDITTEDLALSLGELKDGCMKTMKEALGNDSTPSRFSYAFMRIVYFIRPYLTSSTILMEWIRGVVP
jgi:hypothetical protein